MLDDLYHLANALWPLWGLILFVGIVAYVFWPKNKARLERHGKIPLDDDQPDK
jgi:cytochrome c oxidase cbb3-type subunit 4